MNSNENTLVESSIPSQAEVNQGATVRRKKVYEKPAFLYRAPLEAMAAVCNPPRGKGPAVCGVIFS